MAGDVCIAGDGFSLDEPGLTLLGFYAISSGFGVCIFKTLFFLVYILSKCDCFAKGIFGSSN